MTGECEHIWEYFLDWDEYICEKCHKRKVWVFNYYPKYKWPVLGINRSGKWVILE